MTKCWKRNLLYVWLKRRTRPQNNLESGLNNLLIRCSCSEYICGAALSSLTSCVPFKIQDWLLGVLKMAAPFTPHIQPVECSAPKDPETILNGSVGRGPTNYSGLTASRGTLAPSVSRKVHTSQFSFLSRTGGLHSEPPPPPQGKGVGVP